MLKADLSLVDQRKIWKIYLKTIEWGRNFSRKCDPCACSGRNCDTFRIEPLRWRTSGAVGRSASEWCRRWGHSSRTQSCRCGTWCSSLFPRHSPWSCLGRGSKLSGWSGKLSCQQLTGTLDVLALVKILVEFCGPHHRLALLKLGKLDLRVEGLELVTILLAHFRNRRNNLRNCLTLRVYIGLQADR